MPLRLTWTRTFPDAPRDFKAADGATRVGRIYRVHGGPLEGKWFWVMGAFINGQYNNDNGYLDTKDEAARAVEEAYFKKLGEGT